MIILPQGFKNWQRKLRLTDGVEKKAKPKDVGYQPSREAKKAELPRFTGWALPFNFCPDCERTDITPTRMNNQKVWATPGVWEIDEPLPQIDLRKGDMISYFTCYDCSQRFLWAKDLLHGQPLSDSEYNSQTAERRQKNIVQWIIAARLRGQSPDVEER